MGLSVPGAPSIGQPGLNVPTQTTPPVSPAITLAAVPSVVAIWPLNDANTAGLVGAVDTVAGHNLTANAGEGGIMPQRPSLIAGLPAERSMLYSHSAAAIHYGSVTGSPFDKTGADTVSLFAIAAPNITRSGAETYYWIVCKFSGAYTVAHTGLVGWGLALVWDGAKTVLAFHQRVSSTDFMEVRTTTDIPNGVSVSLGMSRGTGKNQAAVSLYVGGGPQTTALESGSPSSITGSTTNGSALTLAGRGNGGGAETFDGWLAYVSVFSAQLSDTVQKSLSVPGRAPAGIPNPAPTPVTLMIFTDCDTDIDDGGMLAMVGAAVAKGDAAGPLSVTCNSSFTYTASAIAAFLAKHGLGSVPVFAYQGAGHGNSSAFAQTVTTNYNPGKTRADYAAPVSISASLRAILVAQPNASVVILCTAPLHEFSDLLQSPADGISGLTGAQLVAQKATRIVLMGGYAAGGTEYNFSGVTGAPAAANYVFANNPVPIYDAPYELAASTSVAFAGNGNLDPIREAYELHGNGVNRASSFDVIACYYALFPSTPLLTIAAANVVQTVDASTGTNAWTATAGTHNRLAISGSGAAALQIAMETYMNDTLAA